VGICYGILNVYGEVFWPSLSPAIASVAIIGAVLVCPDKHSLPLLGIYIAAGTTIGAVGQMIAQIPGMAKPQLKWGVPMQPQPGLSQYFSMLWPAAVSTSIGQLTIYIDSFFTSQLREGSWTAIVNANRLVQLPLGVLLTAMLVPILPRFTEQVAEQRIDDLKAEFRRALSFLWFLALPIAALLMAIPGPILQVLFERGQFNAESRELVTAALIFLVPSIFFYVARDLITRVYYAQHDSTTPYYVAMAAIVVKGVLDWLLVSSLGVGGISLATTLVTIFNLTVLTYFMRRKIGNLGFSQLIKPVAIMLFASTACGGIAYGLHNIISASVQLTPFLTALLSVSVASAVGLLAYGAICIIFKLDEPTMLLQRVQARLSKKQ
jgi:putative peptidoglycan lipid II flippase